MLRIHNMENELTYIGEKMRARIKRCEVCASKLKDGNCTWSECPKCPKYKQSETKENEKSKDKKDE